jgi:hypothetical protein
MCCNIHTLILDKFLNKKYNIVALYEFNQKYISIDTKDPSSF